MLYQEREQLRSKVQVMWVNGRILHPLQLEKKTSKIAGVGGSIGIPLLKISTTPYWQGSKNSS